MNIIGHNQYVAIPNEKGEYGEPIFLAVGSTLTTNYDEIKVLKKLKETELVQLDEKAIYQELIGKQVVNEVSEKIIEKCTKLKIDAITEVKYYDKGDKLVEKTEDETVIIYKDLKGDVVDPADVKRITTLKLK